ncbi:MAG: DUF1003 domain-containing protein [Actinomycetota bacterium]
MTTPSPALHTCKACRVIDLADGVEDGNLFSTMSARLPHENVLFHKLRIAQDALADRITAFAGSITFVYLHIAWFATWLLINATVHPLFGIHPFDRFPFGLLTLIVSLEAIFLATFVMISQNRQAARSDIRAQLDYETNLRAEIWSVHIGHALGIDAAHVEGIVTQAIEGSKAIGSSAVEV